MIDQQSLHPGFQVHRTQDGGTAIQGIWNCEGTPYIDGGEVKRSMRAEVKARLEAMVPADLIGKRNKAKRLVEDCRKDLNEATQARLDAVAELQQCWTDISDLATIKAAEDTAAQADDRVNAVSNRLRQAEEKLTLVTQELGAILEREVSEIYKEPAPVTDAHRKAEAAIQAAFDKHIAVLSESAALKWFWWDATRRQDGHRSGFLDLAREVLAGFEHEPIQVEPDPETATVAE